MTAQHTKNLEVELRRARSRVAYLEGVLQRALHQLQTAVDRTGGLDYTKHTLEFALSDPLRMRLSELDFGVRACRVFEALKIETVGQLVEYSQTDLLYLRNCGRKTVKEIREVVEELGLVLRVS